jgi:TolB protein
MVRRRWIAWIVAQVTVLALASCSPTDKTNPATTTNPTTSGSQASQTALFYTKAGSLYLSEPAGAPGRRLTDGPADTQPAPSPDGMHVAYVHKANASDYGGELWVLDLSPQRTPVGAPRRLVDPTALPPAPWKTPGHIVNPRWSPAGKQVAFLYNDGSGQTVGGRILVVAPDTGALVAPRQPLFANDQYAWAPDGRHIAWTNARSDVSPVDVSALEVGGASTPAAKDTNAFSVTYGNDGQTIVFANGDASGPDFTGIPFALRNGGIYSAATPGGAPANPPAPPTSLFGRQDSYYGDVAALASGAIAFTEAEYGANRSSKSIYVLDTQSSAPPAKIADTAADGPGPAWGAGDVVAYIGTSPGKPLIITDVNNRAPKQVDTGVDAFAWPP